MSTNDGRSPTSTRALWKGAISVGLVHIPIGLYSATADSGIDFDWLDKRSMEPVGYKRINKVTGKEISSANIARGVEYEDGRYVLLTPEEIQQAYPKTTQTIEIEAFMDADEIPFVYLERPYYTAPLERGAKVYALLREALRERNKVGVAKVVIHSKQHLAILIPCGRALVLNLLRWGGEIRSFEQLDLPPLDAKAAGLKKAEIDMACQLIDDLTQPWEADQFRNSFAEEIMRLVQTKAESGELTDVPEVEQERERSRGADVVDLTALLRRSLGGAAARDAEAKEVDEASATTDRKGTVAKRSVGKQVAARKTSKTPSSSKASSDKTSSASKSSSKKAPTKKTAATKAAAKKSAAKKAGKVVTRRKAA